MKTQAIWLVFLLVLASAPITPAQIGSSPPTPTQAVVVGTNKPAAAAKLSPWANDVAKLARAGVADEVVFSFIDNAGTFNLDADQIIRLHQMDVPTPWIIAMIQHDADVTSGARPLTITSSPSTPATIQIVLAKANSTADKKSVPATTPAPAPTVAAAEVHEDSAEEIEADARAEDEAQAALLRLTREAQEKGKLYRVRQPYPEQVTPPILVFRSASMTPNTLLIQFSQ